jgi:hypothetical protein
MGKRTRAAGEANSLGELTITAPLIVPTDRSVRASLPPVGDSLSMMGSMSPAERKALDAEARRYIEASPEERRRLVFERWRPHRDLMARLDPSCRNDSLEECERKTMAGADSYR